VAHPHQKQKLASGLNLKTILVLPRKVAQTGNMLQKNSTPNSKLMFKKISGF